MPDLSLPHMCFSLDTPVEVARRTFAERYGVAPAYEHVESRMLWVGPVPQTGPEFETATAEALEV